MCGASADLYADCTPARLRQQFKTKYASNDLQRAPNRCSRAVGDNAKRKRNPCGSQEEPRSLEYKKVRLKVTTTIERRSSPAVLAFVVFLAVFGLLSHVTTALGVNRPPKFLLEGQSEIVLRLKEGPETPVGSLIYTLRGFDPDGDPLTFGIRHSSYDSEVLRIETAGNNEANVYLNKELDRETRDEYSIVLTLTDNRLGDGNYVTQSLLLLVEDINDNEPVFRPYQSTLEVPEDSPPGILATLEATDLDEGAYGQVVYYLQELEGDNDVFSIVTHHGKGTIRLVRQLDYEQKSLYQLRVLAVDRANQGPINTGTAALLVKIKDVEDQPPVFSAINPVTRISEDVPIGAPVLQIKAHDGDRGINNAIRYSIAHGGDAHFAIDDKTGLVYTTKALDREDSRNQENGAYILEIVATERSRLRPQPSVSTEITVILTDVNDETPTFRSESFTAEISESAQENTPITFVGDARNGVFDYDQGNNGTFELSIEPDDHLFEISPRRAVNEATFLIRLKQNNVLDFEALAELNYVLVAREIVKDAKWSSVPLKILVRDSNDNFPEFEKPMYEFSMPENSGIGTIVGRVKATDRDGGSFGTKGIRYTNLGGSVAHLLYLDPKSGIISIRSVGDHEFDRETVTSHYLTVEARDNMGHGNRNTVPLVVSILDLNDNAPVFMERQYEAKLFENKAHFEMPLVIKAKDADLVGSPNSEISYEIADGEYSRNFSVDERTGVVTVVKPLDFEAMKVRDRDATIQPIFLAVIARDQGVPSLSSRTTVVVYLHDVNDHAPQFREQYYAVAIPESLAGGSKVLEVAAVDKDGSTPNNQIVYRIQKGASDKFVIASDSGVISVAYGASLDPDLTALKTIEYSLVVLALDGGLGEQQMFASTVVNITIMDVNNKPPIFEEPGRLTILENTIVGTKIFRLVAHDLDADAVLKYYLDATVSEARSEEGVLIKLTEYDFVNAFHLNSVDGVLKVVKLLDRERVEQIKLGVMVEDASASGEKQVAKTFITILIEDVNDNNPKFRKPFYKRSIAENSPNGVTILNVAAFDVDKNRTITYSLDGPADTVGLVQIDAESGEIVVANRIDHEQVQWLNYTVRATDSGQPPRTSLVDVFIKVIDENDNNPYFVTGNSNLSVVENSPAGTRIAMIQAKDADSSDFGKITFLIDKISSQGKFMIDADTGVLMVADKIDREAKGSYMVVVEAWDNYQFGYLSGESRNAFKQLYINILDENDSPPVLQYTKGSIQISEYHDLDEQVAQIKATDADDSSTLNGMVEFKLVDGTGKDLFKLVQRDPWNCVILAKRSLHDYYGNYTLLVSARDLGTPPNVVEAELNVVVLDFNDHAPYFVTPNTGNVTIRVPENATIGSEIFKVRALDDDVGPNAAVLYRLKPDSLGNYRTFAIDQVSGVVTLKQRLDRERQKILDIRVEAYDQGVPPLSTDLDLTVYVRNVNDYEPQFLIEEITVNFTEHEPPGAERVKLPDTVDRDEVDDLDDPPSMVCYFIVFGNENGTFHLEPDTHILTITKEIDREQKANHTLVIKATENCSQHPKPISLSSATADLDRLSYHSALTRPKVSLEKHHDDWFNRYKHSRSLRSSFPDAHNTFPDPPHFQQLISGALLDDSTLVQVRVFVQDINDNAPQFQSKVFTGGLTTAADFGTVIMELQATDLDSGANAQMHYYQTGDIQQTLTEGLDHLSKPPFLVDAATGAVLLNFDPQKGMKGYFDFMVLVNDTAGYQDEAHVFIYLLREDQRVKFVLRQQPSQVRDQIQVFRDTMSNVTSAIVNVDDFKVHENRDGSVDKTKTDLYMHLVDRRDNSILEVEDVLRLIDQNVEVLDDLFKDFNVLDTQPSEALLLTGSVGQGPVVLWLMFANVFIGALLIVVLSLCLSQRTTFKRQLRAACVHSYATTPSDITIRSVHANVVPNTNKHSMQGSNPIWLKAYTNEWYKNDDDLHESHTQPASEHQLPSSNGLDSLDENVLADESYHQPQLHYSHHHNHKAITKEMNGFGVQNNLNPYNVYHQIDRLSSTAQALTKKLETTEL